MGRDAALAAPARADPRRSRSAPRWPCRACTRCSPTRTCPGARRTGSSTTTSRCWRSPRSATRASRWRSSPPTIPETARRAADRIEVDYEELEPLVDPEFALDRPTRRRCIPAGTCCATCTSRTATSRARPTSWSAASTRSGCRTRRSSGPESGLAVPAEDGGVDLFIATQWLHVDRDQVAACLDLPVDKVRFTLAGVGGAFGGREDVSMQIHACLLALHTGRPVKMVYGREESFFGHVHRHPARMRYEHGATRDGRLALHQGADPARRRRVRLLLGRGGARTRRRSRSGPYEVPSARIDAYVVYTDNPPCGAMRGFGAVQTCFAHEAQMDKLAAALEHGPGRAAAAQRDGHRHRRCRPARRSTAPRRSRELLESVRDRPLPGGRRRRPGRDRQRHPRRGRRARRRLRRRASRTWAFPRVSTTSRPRGCGSRSAGGEPLVEVHTAAAEVGQGLVTVMGQIARTELGVENVLVLPADTQVGSAGSSSASRQTHMTGGAVQAACRAVREELGAARRRDRRRRSRRPASTTTGRRSRSTSTARATRT